VRRATAGEFEILGELGRRTDGGIAYLARDLVEPRLVALRLEQSPGGRHNYVLDVLKELDATLPSIGKGCPRCSAPPRGWGRYCPACGFDLSGLSETRGRVADTKLQSVVKAAAGDDYQILGEMPQAEGGGAVFFARERGRRTIVGLRVRKGRSRGYALERTAILPLLNFFSPWVLRLRPLLSFWAACYRIPHNPVPHPFPTLFQNRSCTSTRSPPDRERACGSVSKGTISRRVPP
jgi:hypothetical protein